MKTLKEAAEAFLNLRHIAVTGVSSTNVDAANFIFRKLRDSGRVVFPVNPRASEVEGQTCYPSLKAIGAQVEGVVIASPPASAEAIVRECSELGINWVWIHRSIGEGSYSEDAARLAREKGINLIPGGCPMMFCAPVDFPHKCMRWLFGLTGRLPRTV